MNIEIKWNLWGISSNYSFITCFGKVNLEFVEKTELNQCPSTAHLPFSWAPKEDKFIFNGMDFCTSGQYCQSHWKLEGRLPATYQGKFSLKDPDTDRSSTLQKSFSNQNSRQRSLASKSSVITFKENGPFKGYTRKTALLRATQIFKKVTKVVVNSQINVSFSPALSDCLFLF